jgi:hypothetical protein
MIFYRDEKSLNAERPIQFVRPVINTCGKIINNLYVSDDCKFYDIDEYNSHTYFGDCPEANINIRNDSHGRIYSNINVEGTTSNSQVARVAKIMFDDGKYPIEYYADKQIDHIDPSVPVKNCLENLEFVTRDENMYRAGLTGVMIKKYGKEIAHKVCQMTCEGKSRQEIIAETGTNGQFVDDVRAGRSHKSVSCQYLDKGFEYKTYDRHRRDDQIHAICQLLQDRPDMRVCDICRELNVDHRFVCAIKGRKAYLYISKDYNF